MDSKAFKELEKQLTLLWGEGKKQEAIGLLEESLGQYPEKTASMNLDLAFFYLAVDKIDKCLEILSRSLEMGIWFPKIFFKKYQDDERFKGIFEEWDKIAEIEQRKAKPYWRIYTPKNYDSSRKYPLFVAIHGWGEDVDMFESYWQSDTLSEQYILALPQSSQIMGTSKYIWNDNEKTHAELASMYSHLLSNYSVDQENILVGGFSQGATVAIDLSLNYSYMPVKGFVALNPDKPAEFSDSKVQEARDKGIRGYIITGDKDQSYQQQNEMMDIFRQKSFGCEIDVIENWGHWFPEDLDKRIDKAIKYIKAQ